MNKILEILNKIDNSKVKNPTLADQVKRMKADYDGKSDDVISDSAVANANKIYSFVEKTSPEALAGKTVVARKPKEERKKVMPPKPAPVEKKKPEPKPEPKAKEAKPEPKKKFKITVKSKKAVVAPKPATESKAKDKKEIQVYVKPTDELTEVKRILEDANYKVVEKRVGKKVIKHKQARQDRVIVREKMENVFTTIQKDIPKIENKQGEKVENKAVVDATEKLKKIFTEVMLGIDKLAQNGDATKIEKVYAFFKKLTGSVKFEKGGGVGDEDVDPSQVDLFEHYELMPKKLSVIIDKYEGMDGSYDLASRMLADVEAVGYTFNYYLDGMPYNLRKIGTTGDPELSEGNYGKGGSVGGEMKDIVKFKNSLIQKAKEKGLYENFGQKEVELLQDKYGYTSSVAAFDSWVMDFDLSQI